jgi:hypothetical protein
MNTHQLEARSDVERREVENTVGEIRRRLSPGQLVDELLAYTKDGGGEFISNLGRQATDNPLPVSLIGAGLAWFLFSKGGSSHRSSHTDAAGVSAQAGYSKANSSSAIQDAGETAVEAVRDRLNDTQDKASEAFDSVRSDLSAASQAVKDRVTEGASSLRETVESAKVTAASATDNVIGFLKDQPLVLLGAGLVLGAAIGASVPTTEAEDRLMGKASDDLKKQAKDVVSDQLDQAREVGANLYEDIKNEVREGVAGFSNVRAH